MLKKAEEKVLIRSLFLHFLFLSQDCGFHGELRALDLALVHVLALVLLVRTRLKVSPVCFAFHSASVCRFGDTTLQERINGDNYSILNFYYQQFLEKFPEAGKAWNLGQLQISSTLSLPKVPNDVFPDSHYCVLILVF